MSDLRSACCMLHSQEQTMIPDLQPALAALTSGLLVGVPTETVYGIAADPFSAAAVDGLFALKGRPEDRPIPLLAAGVSAATAVARFDERACEAAERHWPGAITLVLPRAAGVPSWLGDPERHSIGVRVPDHSVALALLEAAGPLAVTSANRSGGKPAVDDAEARAAFGDAVSVYLAGSGLGGVPSTIVDLTGPVPRVLRRGPVVWPGI
jgi:L-threonylcarbamoyladenylate synthase